MALRFYFICYRLLNARVYCLGYWSFAWQALAAQGELNDVTTFSGIVDLFQDKYMTINLNVFNGDDDNTKYNIKEAAVADDDDVDSDAASDDEKEQNDDDDGNDVDNVDCDDNDNYSRRLSC